MLARSVDRPAVGEHDAHAERALARRAPAPPAPRTARRRRRTRRSTPTLIAIVAPSPPQGQRGQHDHGDQQRALDREVDQRGAEARADAGQAQLELDALRRRDRPGVLILHRAVNLDARSRPSEGRGWERLDALLRAVARAARAARARRRAGAGRALPAAPRPTSRTRAGASPATRSWRGSRRLRGARARRGLRAGLAARAACGASSSRGYWQRLAERPVVLAIAWALLLVPAPSARGCGRQRPGRRAGLVPAGAAGGRRPAGRGPRLRRRGGRRVLDRGPLQQHPRDADRVRGRASRSASGPCSR